MTVTNGRPSPFLQLTSDADWESIIQAIGAGDGVVMNPTTSLAPSLDSAGRNAVMAAGQCLVKGKLWSCDASVSTAIPAASASDRIDRLTLRLSRTASTAATFLQPNIITGTPSGSPVIPSLTQTTTGIWDLPIAHWRSTAAGALTGLVDERFDPGAAMQSGLAANMPLWHVRPRLYFQTDTGVLMAWNGSAWNPVGNQPAAWSNMPGMANSWGIGGHAQYRLTVNGDLQVSFKDLTVGSASDGTNIWNAGALPSGFQVLNSHRVACYSDAIKTVSGNLETPALEFESDGSVQCYGFALAATRADLYTSFPLA
jgi:hypothetical protein